MALCSQVKSLASTYSTGTHIGELKHPDEFGMQTSNTTGATEASNNQGAKMRPQDNEAEQIREEARRIQLLEIPAGVSGLEYRMLEGDARRAHWCTDQGEPVGLILLRTEIRQDRDEGAVPDSKSHSPTPLTLRAA